MGVVMLTRFPYFLSRHFFKDLSLSVIYPESNINHLVGEEGRQKGQNRFADLIVKRFNRHRFNTNRGVQSFFAWNMFGLLRAKGLTELDEKLRVHFASTRKRRWAISFKINWANGFFFPLGFIFFYVARNEPIERKGRRSMGVIMSVSIFTPGRLLFARSRKKEKIHRPKGALIVDSSGLEAKIWFCPPANVADSMYVMLFFLIIDLRFPLDGSVRLHFSTSPESRLMGVSETHTRYTVEPSTGNFFRFILV